MYSDFFVGIQGYMVEELDLHGMDLWVYAALANPIYPGLENQRNLSWLTKIIFLINDCDPLISKEKKEDQIRSVLDNLQRKKLITYSESNGIIKYYI